MATISHNFSPSDPTRLGGFEILEKIGEGGMGSVYRAKQSSLDRIVALKILPSQLASDSKYIDSFLREAKAAARLNHTNIVHVYDAGRAEDRYFYAMEFVEGETLASWVKREGALPEETVLGIGICVAHALKHGWDEAQLIHRDVKPDNVMVDTKGNVKLCDLGLSKSFGESTMLTLSGKVFGTVQYMSPEQARAEKGVDFRTDIYALGMMMYHALTGRIPFHGGSPAMVMARQMTEQLPDPRESAENVSPHICRILEKMLAKEADERYATWDEVLRDLELAREQRPPLIPLFFKGESSMKRNSGMTKRVEQSAVINQPSEESVGAESLPSEDVPESVAADVRRQEVAASMSERTPSPHVGGYEQPKKSRAPMLIGAGVGVALLLGIAAGGYYFFARSPIKEPPAKATDSEALKNLVVANAVVEEDVPTNETIPFVTLDSVKSATVYIKCDGLRTKATGSGFVMLASGDTRYIVTNEHVVTDDDTLRPYADITAVFWSGTKQERTARAQVVAKDAELDLAVLKVTGSGLPNPIDLNRRPKLMETMPVFIFGFPHGDKLAMKHGNPEVSVGKAAISSIRRDDLDEVAQVQIDGAMNPGNSGGPVVNANGRLVGVSVATIRGSGIGFAVPATELAKMLLGRVSAIALASKTNADGMTDVIAVAALIDPLNRMQQVSILYTQDNPSHTPKPDDKGNWSPLPNAKQATLTIEEQRARGIFSVAVPQTALGFLWVQGSFVDGNGVTHHFKPEMVRVDTSGVPSLVTKDGKILDPLPSQRPPPPKPPQNLGGLLGQMMGQQRGGGAPNGQTSPDAGTPPSGTTPTQWGNSLGMKFVPLKGTNVLFSIWETRVQDFEAFLKDSGYVPSNQMHSFRGSVWKQYGDTWRNPGFPQDLRHPVVGIDWNDSRAFCRWLTEKERRAGLIDEKQEYRLPTDAEWSAAVGLENEEGGTPEAKSGSQKFKDAYPWGHGWPPRWGIGNHDRSLSLDKYDRTAPVGSFPANQFGLYDMSGNVWEWCEDLYKPSDQMRVMRGGSWDDENSNILSSSYRLGGKPEHSSSSRGFRCVLVTKLAAELAREEAERSKQLLAFGEFQKSFLTALGRRDYAGAQDLAFNAVNNPTLESLKERSQAFGDVAKRLQQFWSSLPSTLSQLKGKNVTVQGESGVVADVSDGNLVLEKKIDAGAIGVDVPISKLTADEIVSLFGQARQPDKEALLDFAWFHFTEGKSTEASRQLANAEKAGADVKTARQVMEWLSNNPAQKSTPDAALQRFPPELAVDLGNRIKMEFVLIHPGVFVMGSNNGDSPEKPAHRVTITRPFYMGKYEVTQEQWQAVMDNNPSMFKGAKNPAENIGWADSQNYIARLNPKLRSYQVRLPTEAEWEYACRAGSTGQYSFGDDAKFIGDFAWTKENSGGKTQPVGLKKPNAWELYDMHGNVWEWCSDWYAADYFAKSPAQNPTGPTSGETHVSRSGSWYGQAVSSKSSARRFELKPADDHRADIGFRLVLTPTDAR